MRMCSQCGIDKEATEFRRWSRHCKACRNKNHTEWNNRRRSEPNWIKDHTCSVVNCANITKARGLCGSHYARKLSGSKLSDDVPLDRKYQTGPLAGRWNGGLTSRRGRVMLCVPGHPCGNRDGYVTRSRLVVEKSIGRFLEPSEHVHHKNGDPADDRLENLQVMSHSDHAKLHSVGKPKKNGRWIKPSL